MTTRFRSMFHGVIKSIALTSLSGAKEGLLGAVLLLLVGFPALQLTGNVYASIGILLVCYVLMEGWLEYRQKRNHRLIP